MPPRVRNPSLPVVTGMVRATWPSIVTVIWWAVTSTTETTDLPIWKSTCLSWSPHTSAPACTPARSAVTDTSVRAGQYSLVRYWTFVSETQFHAPSTSPTP